MTAEESCSNIYFFVSGFGTEGKIWNKISEKILHKEKNSQFFFIPFYELIGENSKKNKESYLKKIHNLDCYKNSTYKQIIICCWSIGCALAIINLKELIDISNKIVMISFTPKMSEDLNLIGYKRIVFKKMLESLNASKLKFLSDFFKNVTSFSKNQERYDSLIKNALLINTDHLVDGLKFLENYDVRDDFEKILNQEFNQSSKKRKVIRIIQGKEDTILPKNQIYQYFTNQPDLQERRNQDKEIAVSKALYCNNQNIKGNNESKSIPLLESILLHCGHDILFEQEDKIISYITDY